ncbi:MAG TPA: UDP-N-acetylmuramate dehydrogenase [Fibrobacteraceae bacterium]|nr:UDP-N-acetylmuramate dehydrogenase [Fibrobacteraceae bacterium]
MSVFIQEYVRMDSFTTFRVGGCARYFAAPSSYAELREALEWRATRDLPWFVLGRGSNLVVSDHGFPGLVIHLGRNFAANQLNGNVLTCAAGCLLHSAVTLSVDAGFAGIECLGGIPGTLGGGTYINAGAFGQELCQTIVQVKSLNAEGKEILRDNAACGFGYRHSNLMGRPEIITEVSLILHPGDPEILRQQMLEILRKRRDKQPLDLPNAGSMFKRPAGGFAGVLIEQSGLKGFRVGDAAVSIKHANFVVNMGHATAQQIWELTKRIIAKVQADHSVTLEREVIFLGDF